MYISKQKLKEIIRDEVEQVKDQITNEQSRIGKLVSLGTGEPIGMIISDNGTHVRVSIIGGPVDLPVPVGADHRMVSTVDAWAQENFRPKRSRTFWDQQRLRCIVYGSLDLPIKSAYRETEMEVTFSVAKRSDYP